MYYCHRCSGEVKFELKVMRRETCEHCEADLHCCLNCRHHDPGAHNQCREPQSDFVSDREAANFCDFFTFSDRAPKDRTAADEVRAKLESLFKK